jgi:hypothetical protein
MTISVPVNLFWFEFRFSIPDLCSDHALFRTRWRTEAPFPRNLGAQKLVPGNRLSARTFEPFHWDRYWKSDTL